MPSELGVADGSDDSMFVHPLLCDAFGSAARFPSQSVSRADRRSGFGQRHAPLQDPALIRDPGSLWRDFPGCASARLAARETFVVIGGLALAETAAGTALAAGASPVHRLGSWCR